MNLTQSMGLGAIVPEARHEAPPVMARRKRTARFNETPTIELTLRFAAWAHELAAFPTPAQIRSNFGVCVATAYRWRIALAAAHGVIPPPSVRGDA